MKLLTASLERKALDWALAVALELEPQVQFDHVFVPALKRGWPISGVVPFDHTNAALCLGLMNQYRANVQHDLPIGCDVIVSIYAKDERIGWGQGGATIEQAVARCVVAMRLGDEVDVPDQLCGDAP